MHQYFDDNTNLPSKQSSFTYTYKDQEYTFTVDLGVFSKTEVDRGSEILIETVDKEELVGDCLDLGCGWGPISIILKKRHPELQFTSIDVNPRALLLTKTNADVNHVDIHTIVSDGFQEVHNTFDTIISNPPIRIGKEKLYGLFKESYEHLNTGGKIYLVIRRKQGAESAIKYLENELGFTVSVIERSKGYWIIKGVKVQ